MSSFDLHPEELFDKAARAQISADEQARLDAHVAACDTCRFERAARADFEGVSAAVGDVDDLVARALIGAAPRAQTPRRRGGASLLLAGAVVLVGAGSFAAVAQLTGLLPRLFTQRAEAPLVVPPPPSVVPRGAFGPQPFVAPEEEEEVVVVPDEAPSAPPPPARVSVPRREVTAAPTLELEPTPPLAAEPDALELLARATRARVRGDSAAAVRELRVVVARYPSSAEAGLAHAALGRLLLDRGEALSALESFDAYLGSGDGALREDVLGARALALQALGRADAERSAWERVVQEYPEGVFVPRAQSRLEALAPSP